MITSANNRTYEGLKNKFNKVLPEQRMLFATSGHGKGLAVEQFIEKWKKATNGIVLCIADPKNEAEFSFVQYEPEERYHVEQLRDDGARPQKHKCKLYHPFTFNLPKSYLPEIDFYTIPIKHLGREEWSILSEKAWDSETIRILMRASENLGRNETLTEFLLAVEKMTEKQKKGKKATRNPKTGLKVSSGTAKSVTEIEGLLNPFRVNDYFLRKESCPYKLDWSKILTDSESYHVFLSLWIKDAKIREFLVLTLLEQIVENRHFAKKPILIVIPEVRVLCPRSPQGYKYFLSKSITDALSTVRSQGRGISSILDSQNWSDTDDGIKGSATITYFGALSTKDSEVVCKAMQYKRDVREQLQGMKKNHYLKAGKEDFGAFRFFMPRHMHKEPHYNWLDMYKKYFFKQMKRYSDLTKFFRDEHKAEKQLILDLIKKEEENDRLERERKQAKKLASQNKTPDKIKSEKVELEQKNKDMMMKLCHEMYHDVNLKKSERSYRKIGEKYGLHHSSVKKYINAYSNKEKAMDDLDKELLGDMIGEGVMKEEVEGGDDDG